MRLGNELLGRRGLLLLGATGVLAATLAVHGYGRGTLVTAGSNVVVGVGTGVGPTASAKSTTSPSASVSSAQKLGPQLGSSQYAPYAYLLYPGHESNQARLATAGFNVAVQPGRSRTITVSISAIGSGQGAQTTTYPAGDRVYFIEASFGDDSGNSEYNTGDDGLIVTNAQGRIVQ